jgi:hypothetical protein
MTTGWPPAGWHDQGQCLGDGAGTSTAWSAQDKRTTIVQIATSCIGLEPVNPVYRDALYPWDTLADAQDMAKKQYKCALTCLMILRAFGMQLDSDGLPYRLSFEPKSGKPKVFDSVVQMQKIPQWEKVSRLLVPGEMGIIYMPGSPKLTHALVCTRVEGDLLTSVDGGFGWVHETRRRIVKIGRDLCLQDGSGNRIILGVLATGLMNPERNWFLPAL